jgi:hypothetical protein
MMREAEAEMRKYLFELKKIEEAKRFMYNFGANMEKEAIDNAVTSEYETVETN